MSVGISDRFLSDWYSATSEKLIAGGLDVTNLQLWLAADVISGLANGDLLTTWSDSTVNQRNATQTDSGQKPAYNTNQINGLPAVSFGSGDRMIVSHHADLDCTNGLSLYLVYAPASSVGFTGYLDKWVSGIGWMIDNASTGNKLRLLINSGAGEAPQTIDSTFRLHSVLSGSGIYESGMLEQSINLANGSSQAQNLVINGDGTSTLSNACRYAEILIYNVKHTSDQRVAVEQYLKSKYGI